MKNYLTTSGFLLPADDCYVRYTHQESKDIVKNLKTPSPLDKFSESNEIYYSPKANKAYMDYTAAPTFRNFMAMVDIALCVLGKVGRVDFIVTQLNNKHMSPVGLLFLKALVGLDFHKEHLAFAVYPQDSRISVNGEIETEKQKDLKRDIHKTLETYKHSRLSTNAMFVADLTNNKKAFVSFFKYVFVDNRA